MHPVTSATSDQVPIRSNDEWVFGWDPTPGIVSVWAQREGQATIWRREGEQVICTKERFRPWLFATTLADLAHLGPALLPVTAFGGDNAIVNYRELTNLAMPTDLTTPPSYHYLISARDGRFLERALLSGATRRLGRKINRLDELDEYYRMGPIEQYLMSSGRVYFRDMNYEDLHRLQFDLETTALDPHRGRIFLVAIYDNRGCASTLEASTPDDEAQLIKDLCELIRKRDPDVIENHNLFGFDLPFLEQRASAGLDK